MPPSEQTYFQYNYEDPTQMAYAPMDVVWLSDQGGNCVCVCDVCAKKERSKMEKVRKNENKRKKGAC